MPENIQEDAKQEAQNSYGYDTSNFAQELFDIATDVRLSYDYRKDPIVAKALQTVCEYARTAACHGNYMVNIPWSVLQLERGKYHTECDRFKGRDAVYVMPDADAQRNILYAILVTKYKLDVNMESSQGIEISFDRHAQHTVEFNIAGDNLTAHTKKHVVTTLPEQVMATSKIIDAARVSCDVALTGTYRSHPDDIATHRYVHTAKSR